MLRSLACQLTVLIAFIAVAPAQTLEPPVTVEPGRSITLVRMWEDPARSVTLEQGDGDRVSSVPGFGIRMTPLTGLRCFMIGVDSTLRPGAYRLVLRDAQGAPVAEKDVEVAARTFTRNEISLTASLTNLRLRDDREKTNETRILTDLILSADPSAVYHFGALGSPVSGARITAPFGDRRTYRYSDGGTAGTIHVGLDLALPTGSPVVSSGAGIVRMARGRIVTGNTVVIEHLPGFFSLSYHLDSIAVEEGEVIAAGDLIGTVGMTGLATGPHLHWEVRVGGVPVEPIPDELPTLLDNSR